MAKAKIPWRHTRLYVNAGMRFPACYASQKLLDIDKSGLPTTGDRKEVTCLHCRKLINHYEKEMGLCPTS